MVNEEIQLIIDYFHFQHRDSGNLRQKVGGGRRQFFGGGCEILMIVSIKEGGAGGSIFLTTHSARAACGRARPTAGRQPKEVRCAMLR